MKIKSVELKNFRRFTHLVMQDIPQEKRLVLMMGSNGSGKSSVFDAFNFVGNQNGKQFKDAALVFKKNIELNSILKIDTYEYGEEGFIEEILKRSGKIKSTSFYGRTSFRQIPRLTRNRLGGGTNIQLDDDRAASFIDKEERFENDLEHLFGKLLKEFFRTENDKSQIKKDVIDPVNESLVRIFGSQGETSLQLIEIIPPLEGKVAEINFQKGQSTFHYNYLSAGEKEVFNIIINLVARREYYTDTIYFFDEIDLHLNTRLQFNFLKEITENWLPAGCQLWTASHSLGFIDYARQSETAVIFDFDDLDFDKPRVLVPEPKDNPNIYQIAVDKELLAKLFQGFQIVFVENLDKIIYGSIGFSKTIFIPENGRNGVFHKAKTGQYAGIVDRDFLSDDDIEKIENQYKTLKVLRYYSIENYIYHPDNLEEYYIIKGKPFDRAIYIAALTGQKLLVKDDIALTLISNRMTYPYFGEPEHNNTPQQNLFKNKQENIAESTKIAGYLGSDDFETFYKVFPMKTYAKQVVYRTNVSPTDLIKTVWFRGKIGVLLNV